MKDNAELLGMLREAFDPEVMRRWPKDVREGPVATLESYRPGWFRYEEENVYSLKDQELNEKIEALLPAEKRHLLLEYDELQSQKLVVAVKGQYRDGLRDGFWLAVELLMETKRKKTAKKAGDGKTGTKRHYPGKKRRSEGKYERLRGCFINWLTGAVHPGGPPCLKTKWRYFRCERVYLWRLLLRL